MENLKVLSSNIIPDIPLVNSTFPPNFVNDIHGWGVDKRTLLKEAGKLLTLDIDFGVKCSLNCPLCFRKNNNIDKETNKLSFTVLQKVIIDAKKLGLKSVKFLGKGEMFENKLFLEFLEFLHEQNIVPLIFTKGHVLGSDELVKKYFAQNHIYTAEQLVEKLYELGTSIMIGFNSFDSNKQEKLVGNVKGYAKNRNKALILMVNQGFNKTYPTRLALAVNPITKENIDEAFDIYKWGRERNMYCIVTPSMISGRGKNIAMYDIEPAKEKLIELYTKIYKYNIKKGIQTKQQIYDEGISAYAGGHPCNQVAAGLYISLNGVVLSCPGSENLYEGNIWDSDIETIWTNSNNKLRRAGVFNNRCIAKDGKTIPVDLYNKVLSNLK